MQTNVATDTHASTTAAATGGSRSMTVLPIEPIAMVRKTSGAA